MRCATVPVDCEPDPRHVGIKQIAVIDRPDQEAHPESVRILIEPAQGGKNDNRDLGGAGSMISRSPPCA